MTLAPARPPPPAARRPQEVPLAQAIVAPLRACLSEAAPPQQVVAAPSLLRVLRVASEISLAGFAGLFVL